MITFLQGGGRVSMAYIAEVKLFTDGGCKPNPGPGAIGVVILDDAQNELQTFAECIGDCTNNQAEYRALIKGLDLCAKHTRKKVVCFLDSELVVNHMNARYRLKDDTLRALYHEVKKREAPFEQVIYSHVGENNQYIKKSHRLLNQALEGC